MQVSDIGIVLLVIVAVVVVGVVVFVGFASNV